MHKAKKKSPYIYKDSKYYVIKLPILITVIKTEFKNMFLYYFILNNTII